jgi:zinc and cadmium transporter
MTLLVFAGLFFPIMIFGIGVYFIKICNKNLKLMVAFSGAFLLSFSFNELIPHIYGGLSSVAADAGHVHGSDCAHRHSHGIGNTIGLFILLGFFIQLILEFITKGVEHGHVHTDCPVEGHESHKSQKFSLSFVPVLIGLSLHSFLEAMPLAKGFGQEALQNRLLLGIVLHNIPIAIVLMSLLIQGQVSKKLAIGLLTIFAFSGPAGVLFSGIIGAHLITDMDMFFNYSMALVVGIFLHISTTILFESEEHHKFNAIKFAVIVLGALAAMIHF